MKWSDETVDCAAQSIANTLAIAWPEVATGKVTGFDKVCAKAALAAVAECSEVKALQYWLNKALNHGPLSRADYRQALKALTHSRRPAMDNLKGFLASFAYCPRTQRKLW